MSEAPKPKAKPAAAPAKPAAAASTSAKPIAAATPPANSAKVKRRHVILLLSFFIWVITPLALASYYLFTAADDQFASSVGFSVRTEEAGSAIELLGGITELSGSSSSDTDILYEFIQSQRMVRLVNEKLDLVSIYTNPSDPVFGLGEDVRIEALSRYWNRMVKVFYDNASGLIEVRVLAYNARDAQNIALTLFEESSRMINELSTIAREDTMGYAVEELDRAVTRLKVVRTAKTAFRNRTQIVDPSADIQGRMGLLNSLQAQLAETSIELQLLLENSPEGDPRVLQAQRKVVAINGLIDQERKRFGTSGPVADTEDGYADLLAEYEELQVDLEFAQKSYLSAQTARDVALAEANRKSRYLAMHVEPTLAETAEYPQRWILLGVLGVLAFISWSIMAMIYYSLRDRR